MLKPEKLIGMTVGGRFVLTRHLGKGAFGWVYAADQMAMGSARRACAVKLLSPDSDEERDAVLREIGAMMALSHGNLITLYDAGTVDDGLAEGCVYLAMELGEGTLESRLARPEPLTSDEARRLAHDLAQALAYLADRGAVHRDVKPANVLRVNGG
jgi:serine/threonine-protein kinase Chk2